MINTKAKSSLVATQRAGQALDADFCRWHERLVDAELVASCTPENCPLQLAQAVHGSVKNPAHIVLLPGVTLADLKQAFGKDDWPLLKDCLPELRSVLKRLAVSNHPASVLPEKGALSHHVLPPHEGEPDDRLVGFSKGLTRILAAWIGFSEQETKEGLNNILSNVAPGSLEQGPLLCEFMHSHFQGFRLFAEQKTMISGQLPIIPFHEYLNPSQKTIIHEQIVFTPWLSTTHDSGLELLDLSLIHLNHLAQLVRYEPLRLDLPQRRLLQKRLLERKVLSATDWLQDTLAVTDNNAATIMHITFIETLSPLGMTQEEESLQQIDSLLCAMPSVEPIEALVKMQRLLMCLIIQCLGDLTFPLSKESDRVKLLARYRQALDRRDKALTNWCACRDGAAAGPHRALT